MGRVDAVIFTGGIGAQDPKAGQMVYEGLEASIELKSII